MANNSTTRFHEEWIQRHLDDEKLISQLRVILIRRRSVEQTQIQILSRILEVEYSSTEQQSSHAQPQFAGSTID